MNEDPMTPYSAAGRQKERSADYYSAAKRRNAIPRLAVVVPCLNEEEALPILNEKLTGVLNRLTVEGNIASGSRIIYVDDGSTDRTWQVITDLAGQMAGGIRLSRNCGHQEALMAGMETALPDFDAVVTIDADMQDDAEAIAEMVRMYSEGADVVYGIRRDRSSDSWFKRMSAKEFYRMMRRLGVECVGNHADFRLLSRRAVADLMDYSERNLFLRGIIPLLGGRQENVYYERGRRAAGKTKYPFLKMIDFAVDGITSFSVRPVRMLFFIGLAFMLTALGIFIYVMVRHFSGETIEGWTSLMLSIWFCTGILLMGLGIIGEYIGKIYIEVKHRPRFRISDKI